MQNIELKEFSKHIYSKSEVEAFAKTNQYDPGVCSTFEVYHAYIGRHDQPDVYDKRACMVIKDLGKEVSVLKITSKISKQSNVESFKISNNEPLNFNGPSYIRLEKIPYVINKKWITGFDGDISKSDTSILAKIISRKYGNGNR